MISVFAFVKFRNGSWQYKMESQTIRQIQPRPSWIRITENKGPHPCGCSPLIKMASPERFELPTLCLGGRCSIRLSYGDPAEILRSLARGFTPQVGIQKPHISFRCRNLVNPLAKPVSLIREHHILDWHFIRLNGRDQFITFHLQHLGSFAPWITRVGLVILSAISYFKCCLRSCADFL